MMTRYARSYSLQKGPSLEDSVEYMVMILFIQILKNNDETYFLQYGKLSARNI